LEQIGYYARDTWNLSIQLLKLKTIAPKKKRKKNKKSSNKLKKKSSIRAWKERN
jgi:hypothetical protein